jgi:hypothetical protein
VGQPRKSGPGSRGTSTCGPSRQERQRVTGHERPAATTTGSELGGVGEQSMNERSGYSGAVRKAVVADWQRCLPQFGPYGPRGLGRRVGCLLQGVELDRGSSSDGYRPILFCCALTVDLVAVDLSLSNTSLPDAGGYPWVTIREHPTGHASVAMKLVERSPIPAAGPVKLSLFVNAWLHGVTPGLANGRER